MIILYEFIKNIQNIYAKKNHPKIIPSKTSFNSSLKTNLEYLQRQFHDTADLTIHEMNLSGIHAAVISIDNMVGKDIMSLAIIKPLFEYSFSSTSQNYIEIIKNQVLYTDDITEIQTFEELEKFIMSGFAVITVDGSDKMLSVGVQGYQSRGISEPESDVIQRGSKEGFVEPLRTNITMLRRRIKSRNLKFEILTVGNISKTEVCLCYLTNIASPKIIGKLKDRINQINLETVLAAGYLVPYLEEKGNVSPFSSVGITERPDTVCGKITEGRIAILIDGVPSALIVPYLFAEYFQTLDDYSNRPYFAVFTRWLKYAAFFVSMLLPGVYVALGTFNPEMFPTLMLNKIAGSIGDTPLSLMAETILIQFVYEIMRESGLRMPQPLGYAVSIVGGLVVGDTAINAGLIGAPTLMVVSITTICSYVIPNLYAPAAILRIFFTLAGGIFGIWGVSVLFCMVFINICGKSSFGVPYTSPISPIGSSAVRDVFFRAGWKTLSKENEIIQNMPGSNIKSGEFYES